jgi:cytochrome c-type biogenesis protein CcmH
MRVVPRARSVAARTLLLGALLGPASGFSQEETAQAPASVKGGADPAFVVGPPNGPPLEGAALDARSEDIGSLLRCPVCQGLSVADSPATMAQNMKAEVRGLVAKGYTEDQVLAYFERSYGEFVRLRPPLRGVNWLVWLGPLAGLLLGGAIVTLALRRSAAAQGASVSPLALPGRDTLPDDERLAAAVRRVREMAYGWPRGKAPEGP